LATENISDELDNTDFRILRALVEDGRVHDVALGERVNLSSTAAARRRKIMEERHIITGYSAVIDQKRLGFTITVLVLIELSSQAEQRLVEFENAVLSCPSMSFCSFISGENDFMMLLNVQSFDDYDRIYRTELSNLPFVAKIRSSFLLREVARRRLAPAILGATR
jgi:Lrp/AsnC family transcriptional regulator, leucine-responsive regulatory protein